MTPFEIAYHGYFALLLLSILWLPIANSLRRKFRTILLVEYGLTIFSVVFMLITISMSISSALSLFIGWISVEAVIIMAIIAYGREVNKVRVSEVK